MISILVGFILGTAVGVANFRLLLWMTARVGHMDPRKAGIFAIGGFLFRSAVYVALIAAALYVDQINVFAAGAGLLAANGVNLCWHNKRAKQYSDRKTN